MGSRRGWILRGHSGEVIKGLLTTCPYQFDRLMAQV